MTHALITPSRARPRPPHGPPTTRYVASLQIIAPPRALGLQGVNADRMYPLASAKDREGGATTRYEAYTGMRVTNYRNTPRPPPHAMQFPCE